MLRGEKESREFWWPCKWFTVAGRKIKVGSGLEMLEMYMHSFLEA